MAELQVKKVVNNLPAQLTANTIYFVRSGAGFDIFITNTTGTVNSFALNQSSGGGGYFETIIWAEENGAVSSNTDEWSYGNGAVGANIGIPSFWNCEGVGMVLNAETVGTSLSVLLRVNNLDAGVINATQRDNFVDFAQPVAITRGQRINFKTGVEVGTWSDVRVGVILRIQT